MWENAVQGSVTPATVSTYHSLTCGGIVYIIQVDPLTAVHVNLIWVTQSPGSGKRQGLLTCY